MRFRITHRTRYRYSDPVFLEPHRLRLTPRGGGVQRVHAETVRITPEPHQESLNIDAEGNAVRRVWFTGRHDRLEIDADLEVETLRPNPFDFLPDPEAAALPLLLSPAVSRRLAPYLTPVSDPRIQHMAREISLAAQNRPLVFLDRLNRYLHQRVKVVVREDGPALSTRDTLDRGSGACRDVAVAYMDLCRAAGIPARFVSGYQAGDPVQRGRHLHAWAEVFIPGGGWRGYDPSLCLAVSDQHVALCASSTPEATLPVEGSFRGRASCAMSVDLRLEVDVTDAVGR